jgi:hypothetical protein
MARGDKKEGSVRQREGSHKKHLVIAQNISSYYNKAWGVKMNLVELVKGTSSEEEADDRCPFCGHQNIGNKKEASLNATDVGRNGA